MAATRNAMIRKGLLYHTIYEVTRIWRHLAVFATERGVQELSVSLTDAYLECFANGAVRSKHTRKGARRALRILTEFTLRGKWDQRPHVAESMLPPLQYFDRDLEQFLDYWEERQVASNTRTYGRRYLKRFLVSLECNGIAKWPDLTESAVHAFLTEINYMSPRSLELIATVIRLFFRFLFTEGILERDWSAIVPHFRGFRNVKLPAVWSEADIEALLTAVERTSPLGKRDYPILLLACRLGMRASDIRTLTLDDIAWEDARIEFIQTKTGLKQVLPLTEEIGEAIIDYLQNARPISECREVFLRHHAPYEPFCEENKLHCIIAKYRKRVGIPKLPSIARGIHSLRHTLASGLQRADVPIETIAGILGHASLETTSIYTRIDVAALRQVALDPEEVAHV